MIFSPSTEVGLIGFYRTGHCFYQLRLLIDDHGAYLTKQTVPVYHCTHCTACDTNCCGKNSTTSTSCWIPWKARRHDPNRFVNPSDDSSVLRPSLCEACIVVHKALVMKIVDLYTWCRTCTEIPMHTGVSILTRKITTRGKSAELYSSASLDQRSTCCVGQRRWPVTLS